jgi:hypothetical protein
MPAIVPPEPKHPYKHDDWVSSLAAAVSSLGIRLLSGSYDGNGKHF